MAWSRRRRRRCRRDRHAALASPRTECALVRRLQRRVHARQSPVLLSADDHRLRQPLSARRARRCRPPRSSTPSPCLSGRFQEFGLPERHPHRQRRAVRVRQGALWPEQAVGLVAPARHSASNAFAPGHPEQNGRHERMHLTLKPKRPNRPRPTSCSSRRASIPSSSATTASARTRRSA